jgi:pentatricopeptide repeat protein
MQNENCKPTVEIYNMLINGYASAKMINEAERLFQVLQESGRQPDTVTYNTLISMYIRFQRRNQVKCELPCSHLY